MRAIRIILASVSLAFAAGASPQEIPSAPSLIVDPYLIGLSAPTGLRFFGANEGFVIEKGGIVKHFSGATVSAALNITSTTASNSERGLLGIALDPAFATNPHVYLYHSTGSGTGSSTIWNDNRVTRYTWNGTELISPLPLGIFGSSGDGLANGPNHNGGVLKFGPPADGSKLYGVTGDLNRDRVEQNNQGTMLSANTGAVFRLNPDGSVPADNPFTGSFNRWYAYGVRNSFGLAFDPVTGNLWNTENGPDGPAAHDEINLVSRAMNSGWRAIQGPDSRDLQDAPGDLNTLGGAGVYQDPKFSFASAIGITSIEFLSGSLWGESYDNAVLVGENNNSRLWLFRLNDDRDGFVLAGDVADLVFDNGDAFLPFGNGFDVTTDIQIGPDGAVYVVTLGSGEVGSGNIYRIAPVPEPKTWALALAGLALVGMMVRRKRETRGG